MLWLRRSRPEDIFGRKLLRSIQLVKTSDIVDAHEQFLRHLVHTALVKTQVLRAHDAGGKKIVSQGVRAVLGHDLHGVGIIFEPLTHLLAVRGKHEAIDYHFFIRTPSEERDAEHYQ